MRERTQRFDPRQNMHRPEFEVFHYQDPKPADVEIHHHDFYEVYFFLGGKIDYRVEGRIYHLEPGDLLLINPTELHQPITKEDSHPYERIVLWINKTYLESFSTPDADLTRCFDTASPTHTNLLRCTASQRSNVVVRLGELVRESYDTDFGSNLCAHSILIQFMVELNRLALRASARQEQEESSPLVSQVLSYIGDHYNEDLSLDNLSQRFFVSKYHLSHEFGRIVGIGVYRYIMLKRLLIAKQLLSEGMSPGTVCVQCGFGDYANFYRAFKAQYGVNPRACIPEDLPEIGEAD